MTLEDSLNQRLGGVVLSVCLLVELEICRARLRLDRLVHGSTSGRLRSSLLRNRSESRLTMQLILLGLLGRLHLADSILVICEICAIQGLKRRDPDREFGSELLVESLITEDGITGVLHKVQMLESRALLAQGLQGLCFIVQLIVRQREHSQFRQVRHAVQILHLVVVQN